MGVFDNAKVYYRGTVMGANRHKYLFGRSSGDQAKHAANTADLMTLSNARDMIDVYFDTIIMEAHNGKYYCIIQADNLFKDRFIDRINKKKYKYFYSKINRAGDGQSTEVLVFWAHKSKLFKQVKYRCTAGCMLANVIGECTAHGLNNGNFDSELKMLINSLGINKEELLENMIDIMMYQAIKKDKAVCMLNWKSGVVISKSQVLANIKIWSRRLGLKPGSDKELTDRWDRLETKLLERTVMHVQVTGNPSIPFSPASGM